MKHRYLSVIAIAAALMIGGANLADAQTNQPPTTTTTTVDRDDGFDWSWLGLLGLLGLAGLMPRKNKDHTTTVHR